MGLLIKLGKFTEEMSRFYISELVMVVESVHKMGFIHRDIKVSRTLTVIYHTLSYHQDITTINFTCCNCHVNLWNSIPPLTHAA